MADVLFDPLIGGLQNVLDLRLQQHALTATNLANADTPGFLARQIDFEHLLDRAVDRGDVDDPEIEQIEAPPWSLDGNSVVPERETARLRENQLMYQGVASGLSKRLALLRYAVSDGKA